MAPLVHHLQVLPPLREPAWSHEVCIDALGCASSLLGSAAANCWDVPYTLLLNWKLLCLLLCAEEAGALLVGPIGEHLQAAVRLLPAAGAFQSASPAARRTAPATATRRLLQHRLFASSSSVAAPTQQATAEEMAPSADKPVEIFRKVGCSCRGQHFAG